MTNKVVVVTGVTSGIGKALALGLARSSENVVLVARDAKRGSMVQEEIKSQTQNPEIDLVLSELSSLSSVRNAAAIIKSSHENIDVLINEVDIPSDLTM